MKILCISQRFFPAIGGAEQATKNLMDFLSERHNITVYTTNVLELSSFWDSKMKRITNNCTQEKYPVIRYDVLTPSQLTGKLYDFPFSISVPGPFSPNMWNDLFKHGTDYDLIIASGYPYNHVIPAYIVSKKHNVPLISIPYIHLEFPEIYFTALRLCMLKASNLVVVNTVEEKKTLLKYNFEDKQINIISPSIDVISWLNVVNEIQKQSSIKKDYGNSITILFVGSRYYDKGIFTLIESLKKLWKTGLNVNLLMIGPSNREFDVYVNKQKDSIRKHIHDLGIISEKEKKSLFCSVDIVALPSRSESFGLVYLEGWICKKPVIGCKIKAVQELITDGMDGLLVDFGNIDHLAYVIEKLAKDANLRNYLGNNGQKKVISKYDSKKSFVDFEKLCKLVTQ